MSTNIVIALDTRRALADGSYPLIMRLGHKRKTLPLSLDIHLHKKDWDENKRLIKGSYHHPTETAQRLNNYIAARKAKAIGLIEKLEEAKKLLAMTVADVRAFIEKYIDSEIENPLEEEQKEEAKNLRDFFAHAEKLIAALTAAKRIGTRDWIFH